MSINACGVLTESIEWFKASNSAFACCRLASIAASLFFTSAMGTTPISSVVSAMSASNLAMRV